MSGPAVSYEDVLRRLREAEDVIDALLTSRADTIVSRDGVHFLRLQETDRALHEAKTSLEELLEERTGELLRSNVELQASESRFRALLESACEAVIAVDESGRIAFVNASTEKTFGYERRELAGAPLGALFAEAAFADALEHARSATIEITGRRKDGGGFPAEMRLSFAETSGGRLALALVTDISDRKRMEARLREAQKLESVGLLASGVAHDFNNLLTAILGNASLLADEVTGAAKPQLEAVIGGAEKAAQVARQLLAYAGKGKFEITDLDLSTLLRENAALIRVSAPKSIALTLDLADSLPRVHADAGQLQQVFMNLVINASEAIGDTPGAITIVTESVDAADGAALPPGRYVRVTVADTGCGMDEATKTRIFDPFFTTKVHGRGLGLSAVLGILRSCAATIEIDSCPGAGTAFKLLFPAVDPMPQPPGDAPERAVAGRSETVLIVDDEDGVRAFAAAALERAGFSVLEASQGEQAVELIRGGARPDLVLLDVTMPVMGGRETFECIRLLLPDVAVVVTSGYGSEEASRLMSAVGNSSHFLQKPFTPRQLVTRLDAALRERGGALDD